MLAAILVAGAAPTLGAEIDSYSARYKPLREALPRIETILNQRLQQGVEAANERNVGCEEELLYEDMKDAFGQGLLLIGHNVALQLRDDPQLAQHLIPLDASVYREMPFLSGISMQLADLMSTVRIDGYEIGLDKFGHFLAQGWNYLEIADLDSEGLDAALSWGEGSERGKYGSLTTGVYSYADLVANFNGLRFWRRILARHADPLGEFTDAVPYVACRAGRWVIHAPIDLSDYVDGAWDEGNNCPEMSSDRNQIRLGEAIRHLERRYLFRFTCPVSPPACAAARERYGEYAQRLLHPECLNAVEVWYQRWVRWGRTVAGYLWSPIIATFDWILERLVRGFS